MTVEHQNMVVHFFHNVDRISKPITHLESLSQPGGDPLIYEILLCAVYTIYSVLSIYRPRILRFSVFTVRHLRSRIKSHINNVIFSCIHRFPELPFSRIHRCKKRSRHSISRINFSASIDRLRKKNLKRDVYVGTVLHNSATSFSRPVLMWEKKLKWDMYVETVLYNSATSDRQPVLMWEKNWSEICMWKPCCIRVPVVTVDPDLCVTFS
jgi:hypothetical protein